VALPVADHELNDDEIVALLSPLFAEADRALRTDPAYVVRMGEAAARLARNRQRAK
jgi:hypothetical protein